MRGKLLVALSPGRVTLARWRAGAIRWHVAVPAGAAALAQCRDHLSAFGSLPVHVLVDSVQEDYRTETLPHARRSERRELVARRLRQHYRNTPYCAAERQGREASGRRDDRYQFAALTAPELLAPWLALLDELGLRLAGVHLLPMAGTALVRRLRLGRPHLLLVARTNAGLRLAHFHCGKFQLSRLAQTGPPHDRERARSYLDEIASTRLYLHALDVMALDEPLSVVLLDPGDEDVGAFELLRTEVPSLQSVRLGSGDIARLTKRPATRATSDSDLLFLHLLALRVPAYNLAPAGALLAQRRHEQRRRLYRACAWLAVAAGAGLAYASARVDELEALTERAVQEGRHYGDQQASVLTTIPPAPVPPPVLAQAVTAARRLKLSFTTPQRAMHVASRAIASTPGITLTDFTWKPVPRDGADFTAGQGPERPEEHVALTFETAGRAAGRWPSPAAEALTGHLRRDANVVHVDVQARSGDPEPIAAWSGSTLAGATPNDRARFTVRFVLRPARDE